MASMAAEEIRYRRSRFATRLAADRLYTAGHYWLRETEPGLWRVELAEPDLRERCVYTPGLWRVGLTAFALRMLGEIVDLGFDVAPGSAVQLGQTVGWLEGFKAVSDLYVPFSGTFEGGNPALDQGAAIVRKDPYGEGWLFALRGTPGEGCLDVHGYVSVLDATIDKMLGKRHESGSTE